MSYDSYNVYVTLHGLIMIFGFAMPVLFGLYGNVLIPLLICSPEVGFAKLNNASYIVYSAAMLLLIEAHLMDILTGLGWTIGITLSTAGALLVCYGVTLAFVALTVMGFSTTFTAANYLSTMIIRCAVPMSEIGTCVHAFATTSFLLLMVLPVVAISLIMLITDTYFNTCFFDNYAAGGDVTLFRHLFWFFGHQIIHLNLTRFRFSIIIILYVHR